MSSPMPDGLPEHYPIGVNKKGEGPVTEQDEDYERTVCWCGVEGCEKWRGVEY